MEQNQNQFNADEYHFIVSAINECVKEKLTRMIFRQIRSERTQDLLDKFFTMMVEETPDVWMHTHNLPEFANRLNSDREFLFLFIGIDNMFRSRIAGNGVTLDKLVRYVYGGLTSGHQNVVNQPLNQSIIDSDVYARWPSTTYVETELIKNPLLLTIVTIHNLCSFTDLYDYMADVGKRHSLEQSKKTT